MASSKRLIELIPSAERSVRARRQNRDAMAAGTLDEAVFGLDVDREACRLRLGTSAAQADDAAARSADEEYRERQREGYLVRYPLDWSENDRVALDHLLAVEVEARRVQRELDRGIGPAKDRDAARDQLRALVRDAADLQRKLGIDRVTRENKASTETPMEEWKRVVESGQEKMNSLLAEVPEAVATVKTEGELIPLAKHLLGFPLGIIEPILQAHRRVLGLPERLEEW